MSPGVVDTNRIEYIFRNEYKLSNKNLMKPEQVSKKDLWHDINQKDYYNRQSIELYNRWIIKIW